MKASLSFGKVETSDQSFVMARRGAGGWMEMGPVHPVSVTKGNQNRSVAGKAFDHKNTSQAVMKMWTCHSNVSASDPTVLERPVEVVEKLHGSSLDCFSSGCWVFPWQHS